MAPITLRVLSSTLLVGAVLHCSASEPGEPTVEPESIITIPEKGLAADEQKSVWLKPSNSLRVVDSSNAAVFLPQPGQEPSAEPSPEQMSAVAYVFENGVCDFEKTVEYKKLFPGHEKPLWVRTAPAAAAGAEEASPAPAANYTFTNPSAEVLGGEGASFCVRFMFKPPAQQGTGQPGGAGGASGGSQPNISTGDVQKEEEEEQKNESGNTLLHPSRSRAPQNEPSAALPSGNAGVGSQTGGGTSTASVPPGSNPPAASMPIPDLSEKKQEEEKKHGSHDTAGQAPPGPPPPPAPAQAVPGNPAGSLQGDGSNVGERLNKVTSSGAKLPLPGSSSANMLSSGSQTSDALEAPPPSAGGASSELGALKAEQKKNEEEAANAREVVENLKPSSRLRRLSAAAEVPERYLTIIVHSSARSVVRGLAAASAALLAGAAWLLPMF